MIEKKDWVTGKKMISEMLVNDEINLEMHKAQLALCEAKIKEFPEEKKEDDPMPEGVKELVKQNA